MDELGYPANSCKYCSLGLACTLANDPATAPWGGLPKPTVLVARLTCDCIQPRLLANGPRRWAREFFAMEAPAWQTRIRSGSGSRIRDWEEVYEPRRIDLLVEEMRDAHRAARANDRPPFRRPEARSR